MVSLPCLSEVWCDHMTCFVQRNVSVTAMSFLSDTCKNLLTSAMVPRKPMLGESSHHLWVTTMSGAPLLNYAGLVCEGAVCYCNILYPIQTDI